MIKVKFLLIVLLLMIGVKAHTYEHTQGWLAENYAKTEVMIPMRDGVRLYAAIYTPKDSTIAHPVIMMRTPYPIRPYGKGYGKDLRRAMSIYADHGYIYVIQNVRGTYLSEGEFVNIRPKASGGSGTGQVNKITEGSCVPEIPTDEATDTYDTAQWIVDNLPTNGSIGVKGTSYPGFYATWAALSGHPAIKAVSPQAPVSDWFMGDDAHHNGSFMLADMYSFGGSFFRPRKAPSVKSPAPLVHPDTTVCEYFRGKSLSELMAPFGDSLRMFNDMRSHPDYDAYWQKCNPTAYFHDIAPAVMVVGGTFDAEDCYGTFETWRKIAEKSPATPLYLVLGPWAHGAWKDFSYNHLDGAYFGEDSSRYFVENIEYPFFAYYLEGQGGAPSYRVALLRSGDTREYTAKPDWEFLDRWPAPNRIRRLYPQQDGTILLHSLGDGTVITNHGAGTAAFGGISDSVSEAESHSALSYISDPANPVPYYAEDSESRIRDYMAGDQRFLSGRKDVLSFVSEEAAQPVVIDGPVRVSLKASCSSSDADFVVKLIDVRPDGYQMLLRGDVMSARYRNGFSKAEALTPGESFVLQFTMCDIAHVLEKGHRLMIQIQSSSFPLVAMNPQTFVPNPFDAVDSDYTSARITIYCGKETFLEIGTSSL